jgi:hypothetical protein
MDAEDLSSAAAQSASFNLLADDAGDIRSFKHAVNKTAASLQHWQSEADDIEAEYRQQTSKAKRDHRWVEMAVTVTPLFLLVALLCMHILKRDARRQELDRERMESELRRERSTLEKRIDLRTAELQSEVAVRQRAEQLNRGRNQLLEMLAREEPEQDIFRTMVDIIAKDRSRWCCALHLLKRGKLHLFSAPVDAESAAHLLATGNNALLSLGNSNLSKSPGVTTTIEIPIPTNAVA